MEVATFGKILGHFSPKVPPSAAGFASVTSDIGGLLWRKLERSKSLVLLQIRGLTCCWQRHSVKPSCWECSTTVEQAETQLRVVVPIEEAEEELCINFQLDAHIIIYSYNITFLYMFRAINAHLQEVTLYACSIWYRHSENKWVVDHSIFFRVTIPYAACIQCDLLKMSIYGSKHVEESNIIWINNNLCIKLVINT
jgi:hypothetical protein